MSLVCTYVCVYICMYIMYVHRYHIYIHNVCIAYLVVVFVLLFYIFINFADGPTISMFPKMQTVILGSQFALSCNASGYPAPHIEWRKNGRVYTTSEDVDITVRSFPRISVSSISVSTAVQDDVGLYECVAINVLGVVSDNATVTVVGT